MGIQTKYLYFISVNIQSNGFSISPLNLSNTNCSLPLLVSDEENVFKTIKINHAPAFAIVPKETLMFVDFQNKFVINCKYTEKDIANEMRNKAIKGYAIKVYTSLIIVWKFIIFWKWAKVYLGMDGWYAYIFLYT